MKVPPIILPLGAVCVGVLISFVIPRSSPAQQGDEAPSPSAEPSREPTPLQANAPSRAAGPSVAKSGERIAGTVLEVIDVPNYVYLRVGGPGSEGTWSAVPTAAVRVGQEVAVTNAQQMQHFTSSTLKRTFDRIYFGVLEEPSRGATRPNAEPSRASDVPPEQDPRAVAEPKGKGDWAFGVDPHTSPGANADSVPVGSVTPASGSSAVTVAKLYQRAPELVGKTVRLRAVVVKSTSGVLGRTFVHLRDHSGSSNTKDNDLTATTDERPALGSTVLFEGTVARDVDFGSGYRYPVLLEQARSVAE